ncbi:ABC transporter permease [Mycolicibacterium sp. CBMA 295]|uniref:ABC transporter permease n=1 Tax=Mycolicibacterium sp. CBMA 295 TaxID=2606605 RepID=UPI00130BC560|nr:ABC transporter permease [Mycolicibacterium sp. CBMA 295]MUM25590.1 ABC transporter permease [Mycolicibacterium sp. CBMA 295]
MSTKTVLVRRPKPVSTALFRHPRGRLAALLTAPMIWLVGVYLLSLALMLITAFWTTDPFTSRVRPGFTLDNFVSLVTVPAYLATSLRTLGIAIAVTVICAAFAIPLAVFMAKVAKPGYRSLLAIGVTLPLWAGYLVKIIGMRLVWTENGFFNWALSPLGITGPAFGTITVILTLVYLWFPYMAIPVYSAVSQIPANLFDASADLGANGFGTIRTVTVFTFSLSFGDYISAMYVGGSTQMIGSIIASNINLNPPLAAAFSVVPIVMVLLYLAAVRRSGALNNL